MKFRFLGLSGERGVRNGAFQGEPRFLFLSFLSLFFFFSFFLFSFLFLFSLFCFVLLFLLFFCFLSLVGVVVVVMDVVVVDAGVQGDVYGDNIGAVIVQDSTSLGGVRKIPRWRKPLCRVTWKKLLATPARHLCLTWERLF